MLVETSIEDRLWQSVMTEGREGILVLARLNVLRVRMRPMDSGMALMGVWLMTKSCNSPNSPISGGNSEMAVPSMLRVSSEQSSRCGGSTEI